MQLLSGYEGDEICAPYSQNTGLGPEKSGNSLQLVPQLTKGNTYFTLGRNGTAEDLFKSWQSEKESMA